MWKKKQPSAAAYSNKEIAERVAQARNTGWKELRNNWLLSPIVLLLHFVLLYHLE